jgi:predicted component of type VI protein secretion system
MDESPMHTRHGRTSDPSLAFLASVHCSISHYMKVLIRDKIGSFMSRADTERFLNQWIAMYVLADDSASAESKA